MATEKTAAAPPALSAADIDELLSNLRARDVRNVEYVGNLKGAPITLRATFDRPAPKTTSRSNDDGED